MNIIYNGILFNKNNSNTTIYNENTPKSHPTNMSYIDTLLSSSRLINRRVRLSTCSGLERHLLDELHHLSLKFNLVSRGKSYVDISTGLDTIWSIIKNSRICRQLYIHVCDPFEAETRRTFLSRLNSVDWGSFIPFSHKLPPPSIKVTAHKSKLYHTGMIRNMVESVINSHCYKYKTMQGDELPMYMKRRGYVPLCPKISVEINNNNCEVLADASGDMAERSWQKISLIDDRIVSSASAAVIQELISRAVLKQKAVVWDPFCHNGSLLLEIKSYLAGTNFRPESWDYPLNNFPLSTQLYEDIKISRHNLPCITELTLIGTDPDSENINCANELLTKMNIVEADQVNNLITHKDHVRKPQNLKFECKSINEVKLDLKDCVLLTNLYYGNKSMKRCYLEYQKQLCKFIKSNGRKMSGVYVISPTSFKKVSGLKWETLINFNNNGIIVEMLRLIC